MLDIKLMKERKRMRLEIMVELYNLYFNSPTQNNYFVIKTNELYAERNSEKHLAYHYLVESNYINIEIVDSDSIVMITAKGIDYVETIYD